MVYIRKEGATLPLFASSVTARRRNRIAPLNNPRAMNSSPRAAAPLSIRRSAKDAQKMLQSCSKVALRLLFFCVLLVYFMVVIGLKWRYLLPISSFVKSRYACSVTVTLECPNSLLSVKMSIPFIKHLLAKLLRRQCGEMLGFKPAFNKYFLKLLSKLETPMDAPFALTGNR